MMPETSTLLFILLILLVFSAFFSASEAALIALNKIRLRHMLEQNKRGAKRIYRLISRMDKLIATILVGNTLVNTAVASLATAVLTQMFGGGKLLIVGATLAVTMVLVIFCELIPKILATGHPEAMSFAGRHLISFFIWIMTPLTYVLTSISNAFIRLFGGNPHHRGPLVTEEEIKMMINIGKEEGFYGDSERKMLVRIFHFDEIEVREVMTPLDKMTAIPVDIAEEELERVLLEEGHNRIPVYRGTKDNILGVLYVRDLVYYFKNKSLFRIEDLVAAAYFVPSNKKASELLKDFQSKKTQIAIVKDSKTLKAIGLVTLEDLIEEIVGELEEVNPNLTS